MSRAIAEVDADVQEVRKVVFGNNGHPGLTIRLDRVEVQQSAWLEDRRSLRNLFLSVLGVLIVTAAGSLLVGYFQMRNNTIALQQIQTQMRSVETSVEASVDE